MPALALWTSLFFVSAPAQASTKPPTPAPTQVVSLVDLLVEGQTLYTMAVDAQRESLTAALDLARQAQRAVADDTVRRRLPAGAHADAHDLTVLGALRARISTLASALERAIAEDYRTQAARASSMGLADDAVKLYRRAQAVDPSGADYDALGQAARDRASFLSAKREEIRSLLENRRLSSAAREMATVEPLLPVDEGLYQFQALKADLVKRQDELSDAVRAAQAAMDSRQYASAERLWRAAAVLDRDQPFEAEIRRAQDSGKVSGHTQNRRWWVGGVLVTGMLAGTGLVVQHSMNETYDQMSFVPPGSSQWWNLHDNAEGLRKARNGLYVAAIGVGAAFSIYGAVRANTSPSRPLAPRTWVGFGIDPRRPAIMVVRTF